MGRPRSESELVRDAQRGDVAAFEALVAAHQEVAFRAAYLVCGDAADAQDAAQEAFMKAYSALRRFDARRPLRPWLLTIVMNEARNRRRSAGRREHLAVRAAAQVSGDPARSPEAAAVLTDERTALREALATLPERDREVIWLRFFLDLSEAEAAGVLGIRRGTVKSRQARALGRLRALTEAGDG